jgi:hypothetical protein
VTATRTTAIIQPRFLADFEEANEPATCEAALKLADIRLTAGDADSEITVNELGAPRECGHLPTACRWRD